MTLLCLLAGGCAGPVDERVAAACEPIVGGEADASYGAVVAVLDPTGAVACSGTLIGADAGGAAVVLTAAHCLDQFLGGVAFEQTRSDGSAQELAAAITSARYHPRYERRTGAFDLGLLTLDRELPVAPLAVATSDALEPGSDVTLVGYGETDEGRPTSTERNRVVVRVDGVTPEAFSYEQATGGACFGDSGGPAIATPDGVPALVGVTSYGEGGCHGRGVSVRTSAAADFIISTVPHTRGCTALVRAGHWEEKS